VSKHFPTCFRCCSSALPSPLSRLCSELFTVPDRTQSLMPLSAPCLPACLPSPAGEVQRVLRAHLERLRQSPTIAPFAVS
jgi:hypothetical protein